MPVIFEFGIDSAEIDPTHTVLTVYYHQGGENLYPSCAVSVDNGSGPISGTITDWSDTQAVVVFASALPAGTYSVTVTNADNVTDTLSNAFTITSTSSVLSISRLLHIANYV